MRRQNNRGVGQGSLAVAAIMQASVLVAVSSVEAAMEHLSDLVAVFLAVIVAAISQAVIAVLAVAAQGVSVAAAVAARAAAGIAAAGTLVADTDKNIKLFWGGAKCPSFYLYNPKYLSGLSGHQ